MLDSFFLKEARGRPNPAFPFSRLLRRTKKMLYYSFCFSREMMLSVFYSVNRAVALEIYFIFFRFSRKKRKERLLFPKD
jgi:hypothetical protein